MNIYYDPSASSAFMSDIDATIPKNYLRNPEYADRFEHSAVPVLDECKSPWTTASFWLENVEEKEKCRERALKQWETPEYRATQTESRAAYWDENEEAKKKCGDMFSSFWQDPDFVDKQKESKAAYWASPEGLEKKRQQAEISKQQWQCPIYRAKVLASRKKNKVA